MVAEIVSVEPHPDSKKLNVCKVDTGDQEPVLIVCGAPNATAGLRVPFARVGASLPAASVSKPSKFEEFLLPVCFVQKRNLEYLMRTRV